MKSASKTILFIAIRQGYFSREVLRGVLSVMMANDGYELWVVPMIHEKRHLQACLESGEVAGVITRGLSRDLLDMLHEREIPVVSIRGPRTGGGGEMEELHVDDESIGRKAGAEFERLNLDYWGFVDWQEAWSKARADSFKAYAVSRGAELSVLGLSQSKRHSWGGVLAIQSWLETMPKPCGVLACNDEAGVDVLHACKLAGLSVPGEVAVIGVDNDRLLCESTVPPLSSIDLHAADVGKAAASDVMGLLDGNEVAGSGAYMGQSAIVMVRESSHTVDRYLLVYQKALDYIGAQALAGPTVAQVADSCGTSRRGLERAFAKHAGRTPAEVIREQRLEVILRLLKTQSVKLGDLARQAGFSDAAGLSNFIKRMTGETPGRIRL